MTYRIAASSTVRGPGGTVRISGFNIYRNTLCECIYVFCVDLRTAIISLYSINWLVFITETEYVYCAVRAEYI